MRIIPFLLLTACPPPPVDTDVDTDSEDVDTDTMDVDTDTMDVDTDTMDVDTDTMDVDTDTMDVDTDTMDVDTDTDTVPPPPDPITTTVYHSGELAEGAAVVFFDLDGNVLLDTTTDASGQASYTPANNDPVHVVADGNSQLVFWGSVMGGSEPVYGSPSTVRGSQFTLDLQDRTDGEDITQQVVYTPNSVLSRSSYADPVTVSIRPQLDADGTFDVYSMIYAGEVFVASVRMDDVSPTQDGVLTAPEWNSASVSIELTATGSGDFYLELGGWSDDMTVGFHDANLTSGVAYTADAPADFDSLEGVVYALGSTSIREVRRRLDAGAPTTLAEADFLAPPTDVVWDESSNTLSWTAADPFDVLRTRFDVDGTSVELYLPSTVDSPFVFPTFPSSIADTRRGGGSTPDGAPAIYLEDGPFTYPDYIQGADDGPLNLGETRRRSTNQADF